MTSIMAAAVNPRPMLPLLVAVGVSATARGEPIDRVLFVVGDRLVTVSDVAFERYFDARDESPVPAWEGRADTETMLLEVALARQVAGDGAVFRPTNAEVRARADRFLGSWGNPEAGWRSLGDWGLDETAFLGFVYSRMVAERAVTRSILVDPRADPAAWRTRYDAWIAEVLGRAVVRRPAL
jgi:hypothetical protein